MIGAGVIGVCCAYYLAKRGRSVTLIDQGEICSGCSYGNACLITTSHAVPLPAPGVIRQAFEYLRREDGPLLIRPRLDLDMVRWLLQFAGNCRVRPMMRGIPVIRDLCRASLTLFQELVREEDLQFHFEQRGALYVNSTEAGLEKCGRDAELLARHGFEVRILSGREAHELEPAVLASVPGAVYYPEDAHGDSHLFVTGLARRLTKLDVTVCPRTAVTGLFTGGRDRVDVLTGRGPFSCRDLVIAAGSWTPKLTRLIGENAPIQPGKGYSVTIPKTQSAPRMPIAHQEKKVMVTPIGDRLRFAGTLEFSGMDFSPNEVRSDAAMRAGRQILQPFADPPGMERWCGLRPCTPDGIPIISPVPHHSNIYVAAGHAMLGYTMGPITGKLVCEMIAGDRLSLPDEPLRLARFA